VDADGVDETEVDNVADVATLVDVDEELEAETEDDEATVDVTGTVEVVEVEGTVLVDAKDVEAEERADAAVVVELTTIELFVGVVDTKEDERVEEAEVDVVDVLAVVD
jgi:hypothetical protein